MSETLSQSPFNLKTLPDFSEHDRVYFFEAMRTAFDEAAAGHTAVDTFIRVAGQTIKLHFAGNALVSLLTRAFSHVLTTAVDNPDLTVCLWDSTSTATLTPPLLNDLLDFIRHSPQLKLRRERGDILPLTDERMFTSLHAENILTILDLKQKTCIYWVKDASLVPYYDVGSPLRMPISWWFGSETRQFLHSGAIGTEEGGALLSGKGGSGKSTTALNSLNSPLFYASDDYVLVELEPEPVAHTVYNTAKVKTRRDLARFSGYESWVSNASGVDEKDEKPMIFVNENMPEKILRRLPLKAIVFPKFITGEEYRYKRISQQTAFREISLSTLVQTPYDDKQCLQMLSRLVRRVPSYELVFGEEQSCLPEYIARIISENI